MRTLKEILETAVLAMEAAIQDNHIKVWRFQEAPDELRGLSQKGGDEDWLALVPDYMDQTYHIPWLEGAGFGCCGVDRYPIAGATVYIGSHA